MSNVATIILAGGEGTRLQPLTSMRCKPIVSFAGRYRIIDVALSNALNAGFQDIYILSQFLADSLSRYISASQFVSQIAILNAKKESPYLGTADAVRKNIATLCRKPYDYFIILSGDQLYSMDLSDMLAFARKKNADLTIATIPIDKKSASRMGIMKIDEENKIIDFHEKPQSVDILDRFDPLLASMGIYIFKREALITLLEEDPREDFGKHLIPTELKKGKTYAYLFNGYWEDIGTIRSYYDATLNLLQNTSCLDLYNEKHPIFTQAHLLPSPKIINTRIADAIICEGSIVAAEEITRSMIGMCTHIGQGTKILDSIVIGSSNLSKQSSVVIGKGCHIEKVIIDEGAKIGNFVRLTGRETLTLPEEGPIICKEGILIVKSGAVIPDHFSL